MTKDFTAILEEMQTILDNNMKPNSELIRRFVQETENIQLDNGDLLKSLKKFIDDNQATFDSWYGSITNVDQEIADLTELLDTVAGVADLVTNADVYNEVVTSDQDLTPTTATDGEQKKTLSQFERRFNEAIQAAGGVSLGEWYTGLVFNEYNEFAVFNGVPYKPQTTTTLPYTTQGSDPTAAPDVDFVQPFVEVEQADLVTVREDLLGPGTQLYMGSDGETVKAGDVVPVGTTHLRFDVGGSPTLVVMSPLASGEVTVLSGSSATIGGVPTALTEQGVPARVGTINELKGLSTTPKTVWVSGYHEEGDGAFGSNIFEWDADSADEDNLATVIKLNTITEGRYKLRFDDTLNIKWFGAVGDGLADDTNHIQAALDYLDANRDLYTYLHFPPGLYRVFDTLRGNTNPSSTTYRVTLCGSVLSAGGNTSKDMPVIKMDESSSTKEMLVMDSGFAVQGLGFDFPNARLNGSATDIYRSVVCDNFSNVIDVDAEITSCEFTNFHKAIAGNGRGISVLNCSFALGSSAASEPSCVDLDMRGSSGEFLPGSFVDQVETEGFRVFEIRGNRVHAVSSGALVSNRGEYKNLIKGIHVVSNYVDTSCRLTRGTVRDSLITGNTIINSGTTAVVDIAPDEELSNVSVVGNVISGIRQESLGQSYADGSLVTQSEIDANSPTYMIACAGKAENITVTGNNFSNSSRDVFLFTGSISGVNIHDNIFSNICRENMDASGARRNVINVEFATSVMGLNFGDNVVHWGQGVTGVGWNLWLMNTPSATGAEFEIGSNYLSGDIIYGDWSYSDNNWGSEMGSTFCGYYTGDGGDTNTTKFTGKRKAKSLTVTQVTGTNVGQSLTVLSNDPNFLDLRLQSGVVVFARKSWNESGSSYSFVINY